MDNYGEILIYQSDDGLTNIEVKVQDETVWLTQQQMADLFRTSRTNVMEHIKHIYDEGELDENSTCRKFRQVRKEGNREVAREMPFYNLDMIISLGYRVKSSIATNFRRWATERLKEYMIKGFTMDDNRLKELGGGGYFKELLERIRDIRASERYFCCFRRNSGRGNLSSCGCRKRLHGIDVIFRRTTDFKGSENCKELFG